VGHALGASPEGPPLLLIAPKQTTYQLERQLLAQPGIPGYTRLHILSFERLAHFIFNRLGLSSPEMLDEEGRLMVLRGLLARKRHELKLFRASARLTGFAQQLSQVLRELQRRQLTPESLLELAGQVQEVEGLAYKLQDLATLLRDYLEWVQAHGLQDADCLLAAAVEALDGRASEGRSTDVVSPHSALRTPHSALQGRGLNIDQVWVDGFAEWSLQELDFLAALMPHCRQATLTFCLDRPAGGKVSWLSNWSVVRKSYEECQRRLSRLANAVISVETLPRHPGRTRFLNNPVLQHLEESWADPRPYAPPRRHSEGLQGERGAAIPDDTLTRSLRVAMCSNPEAEVSLAAREVLRHVREGGRYREVTVLVRRLEGYHEPLQRIFSRYEIPFFLDRRESVSHHPLAELTRSALRTVASGWQRDDWFAALKTGLAPAGEVEVDRLENEALARGWQGSVWQKPIVLEQEPELTEWLADLHRRLLPPFQRLALAMAAQQNRPTGRQMALALREFWQALEVPERLERWAAAEISSARFRIPGSVHATVWEQMNSWLDNVELAFPGEPLSLREWLPILDAGLANLSVGVIPPALDQVLIGAIDRSRNPDIKLALVLGLNETLFPAPPEATVLLTDADRLELEKRGMILGATVRQQLGRERYYAYIACTRARQRVVLTAASHNANGAPLNPSPFLSQARQLFPSLPMEFAPQETDWRQSEHPSELVVPLLKAKAAEALRACPKNTGGGAARDFGRSQGGEAGASPKRAVTAEPTQAAAKRAAEPPPVFFGHALSSKVEVQGGAGILPASSPLDEGPGAPDISITTLSGVPALASVIERLRYFQGPQAQERLSPALAARLYGPSLRTSVSRMEQFAACPFKFFVNSGLRAEERKLFELDVKEQGTFQHDVLALFHEELCRENKRWRDITPSQARERVAGIAKGLMASYRDGLLQASEQSRFMARILTESLQDFVETLVGWMQQQYQFDPASVELPFGEEEGSPAWVIPIDENHQLALHGRIDRVDFCREPATGSLLCVVVDYKSGHKQLDPVLMAHGLQLQLLTYLNVLRHWPNPQKRFGAARLTPAGVFYVSLRGRYQREANRSDALADAQAARKLAYRHTGRFDSRALSRLDARPAAREGDQFNYRLTSKGVVDKRSPEAMDTAQFQALLDAVKEQLRQMGRQIYSGRAEAAPYRKGAATACDQCSYRSICRIDPWTRQFRVLRSAD
jgi:ATP-dependent helicase/nuclease subunit B